MRTLYLTYGFNVVGRDYFRGRRLAEAFGERGELLVRHTFVDDRMAAVGEHPKLEPDFTDARELADFAPTIIWMEYGAFAYEGWRGRGEWRVPPDLLDTPPRESFPIHPPGDRSWPNGWPVSASCSDACPVFAGKRTRVGRSTTLRDRNRRGPSDPR